MAKMCCKKRPVYLTVPAVLAALSTLFVLVPLIAMFASMDADSVRSVFSRDTLLPVLGNSVAVSGLTTVISLTLGYLMALSVERTAIGGKKIYRALVTLPMLIPSVSIGMGVVLLGGNNGILTELLGLKTGGIYGMTGIVIGSVLYSLPVAFLMIDNILQLEDSSAYEAATVLGIPKWKQFTAITLPYLRKPLIVAAFSVFTLSFTDYGVPLMVGGKCKTLPVVMYQEVIGQLDFGKGCVYGGMLLIPAVAAFLVDYLNKNNANGGVVTKPFTIRRKLSRDIPATVCAAAVSQVSMLPILSFVVLAFVKKYPTDMSFSIANIEKTFRMHGGEYLLNSVLIALLTAVIGVTLAVLAAYYTARTKRRFTRYLHLVNMSVAAVPGVVLGLSYVLLFKGLALYGTLAILVMVNVVHFFASPYLMMYTSFSKLNPNLESVASTLGVGHFRLLLDELLPRCTQTVAEMFSYFFVNCMMTISAVSFLANTRNKPIALMINQFEAQAQMECAAVVSLLILLANLLVKAMVEWLQRRLEKK